MLSKDQIDQARGVCVTTLASQKTKLFGRSRPKGLCPFCNGKDFSTEASTNRWFCNDCTPRGDDAIGYIRRLEGIDFRQAVEHLTDGEHSANLPFFSHKAIERPSLPENIRQQVAMNHNRLMSWPDGQAGLDYLASRGLFVGLLEPFNIGYYHDRQTITLPWYNLAGDVVAVRHRSIDPESERRYHAQQGSQLADHLFGTRALKSHSNLVICEGEINCLTLYQIAIDFDVLSIGGESQHIPDWVTVAYPNILVWCDKEHRAVEKATAIAAQRVYWGEDDANDLCKCWANVSFAELPGIDLESKATNQETAQA